jgi:hypothetical protein
MYCSILITVSQEEDSSLHMQWCQVCTVPFWSQYHKRRILNCICSGVRYVLLHSDHSITRRGFYLAYAGVSGMYCSILIPVSQEGDSNLHMQGCQGMYYFILITVSIEGDSNLHMQGCQVCTVPFWSQYHKQRIPTYILQGRQVYTVPFWSQYHKKGIPTYICRGVRYVLFHSDHVSQERDSNLHMQGCQVCSVSFWSQYY